MPSFEEEYSFRLTSNFTEGEQTGSFTVTPAAPGNHGPVRVCGTYHFAYEDATPYYSIGTTCYDFYLRYVIARYAAYRNVWWSLANEYDIMTKTTADWERFAAILCREDPVSHLRSIHNCIHFYDHSRPWVTHASVQRTDNFKTTEYTDEWRRRWNKPVVIDEMVYDGNLEKDWGNINGSSPERFKFLYKILCETPGHGLTAGNNSPFMPISFRSVKAEPEDRRYKGKYFIYYYGFTQPAFASFHIDDETEFQVEILDTWNMTITDGGVHKGAFRIELPGRQYMAVRLKATDLK